MANPVQVIGTVAGAVLRKRAADKQEQAIRKAANAQIELQKRMYEESVGRFRPYQTAGDEAVNRLAALYGVGGAYTTGPTKEQLLADPLYGAGLDESIRALERSAAARGGLLSGRTVRGVRAETLQGLQNAYLREMGQREAVRNALFGLTEGGLNAAAQTAAGGRAYATGAGQSLGAIGTAQANRAAELGDLNQTILGDVLSGYSQYRGMRMNQLQPVTIPSRKTGLYGGSASPIRLPPGVR